jgi:hypothetical protein
VGNPAASLIEAAEEGAPERMLIAVGSRRLEAVQRLRVGSLSTKVLRASKEPLLIVHRDRRETRGGTWPTAGSEIRWGPVLESVDARPSPTTSRRTRYPRPAGSPGLSRRLPDAPVPRSTWYSRPAHRAPQHPSTRSLKLLAPDSNIHTS